jgi:hypothetical protein
MREIISLENGIFRDASSVAQRTAAGSFFLGIDILCNPCKALNWLSQVSALPGQG